VIWWLSQTKVCVVVAAHEQSRATATYNPRELEDPQLIPSSAVLTSLRTSGLDGEATSKICQPQRRLNFDGVRRRLSFRSLGEQGVRGDSMPGWVAGPGPSCSCSQTLCCCAEVMRALPLSVQCAPTAVRKPCDCEGPLLFNSFFDIDDFGFLQTSKLHRQIASYEVGGTLQEEKVSPSHDERTVSITSRAVHRSRGQSPATEVVIFSHGSGP
jgi:hypothetical protein